MKKTLIGILILAVAGGGFFYWKNKKKKARSAARATAVMEVTRGSIERTVEANGEVTALNRVEIKPPLSGRVENLLADEGTVVKSGQILAWMSSSDRAAILDAARAKGPEELKRWEDTYKPTPIVAPLSGTIILRNVVVGQTVDSSNILFAMADRLIINAQVDEADIGRVLMGLPARITLDAYPDRVISGKVFQILYEGKNVSNVITYGVKIAPEKVPPFFRSQMTANVSLVLEHRDDVVLVPAQAVKQTSNGEIVMVPGPEGKPVSQAIKTGMSSGEKMEVVSGLQEGDKVVVTQARYTPQKNLQNSPLTMGGSRPPGTSGSGNATGSGQRRERN